MQKKTYTYEEARSFTIYIFENYYENLACSARGLIPSGNNSLLGSEDLLSMLFLKCMLNYQVIKRGYQKSGISYLIRIMKNQLNQGFRQRKQLEERLERYQQIFCETISLQPDLDRAIAATYQIADWVKLLSPYLRPKQIEILTLSLEGVPHDEIGLRLGLTANAVSQRKLKALNKLKMKFKKRAHLIECLERFIAVQEKNRKAVSTNG